MLKSIYERFTLCYSLYYSLVEERRALTRVAKDSCVSGMDTVSVARDAVHGTRRNTFQVDANNLRMLDHLFGFWMSRENKKRYAAIRRGQRSE